MEVEPICEDEKKLIGFDDEIAEEIRERVDEHRSEYRQIDSDKFEDIDVMDVLCAIGATHHKGDRWSMPGELFSSTPKLVSDGSEFYHFEAECGGASPVTLVMFWKANGETGPYGCDASGGDVWEAVEWICDEFNCWMDYGETIEEAKELATDFHEFFGADEEAPDE